MPEYALPIPHLTARLPRNECANPGLLFDRYAGYVVHDGNWSLKASGGHDPKRDALKQVIQAQVWFNSQWTALRDGLVARWKQRALVAGANPKDQSLFKASPTWRFVTGLGRNSPLEVGFAFDRVYGLPIIPGSGLKGLTRAAILWALANHLGLPLLRAAEVKALREQRPRGHTPLERLEVALLASESKRTPLLENLLHEWHLPLGPLSDTDVAERVKLFRSVFGAMDDQGDSIFLDAVPETVTLEIDVMTPHYPEYYRGSSKEWPTDWQSPNPVPFLAIGRDSEFYFAVAGEHRVRAAAWLRQALDWPGAGAKTAAGYGTWEPQPISYESEWQKGLVQRVDQRRQAVTLVLEDVETHETHRFELRSGPQTPGKGYLCEYRVFKEGDRETVEIRNVRKPAKGL